MANSDRDLIAEGREALADTDRGELVRLSKSTIAELLDELEQARARITELEADVSELDGAQDEANTRLAELARELNSTRKLAEREAREAATRIGELELELKRTQARIEHRSVLHARIAELEQQVESDRVKAARAVLNADLRIAELEAEQAVANGALDDIALRVRPDDDGTWTDSDGLLESIGEAVRRTGRKVWAEDIHA